MRQSFFIVATFVVFMGGCAPHSANTSHADFRVGVTKSEILKKFGKPKRTDTVQKTDEAIWGAIESFWSTVPQDSRVEIWFYETTESSMGKGETELYFIDGSKKVDGKGFSPEGVVYESESGS